MGTGTGRFVDLGSAKLEEFMIVPISSLKLQSAEGGKGFAGLRNED